MATSTETNRNNRAVMIMLIKICDDAEVALAYLRDAVKDNPQHVAYVAEIGRKLQKRLATTRVEAVDRSFYPE